MRCEIVCIIDRSGSMATIREDAIGGFNTFLEDQQKVEGEANLTFIQFDTDYEVVHENLPLMDVPPLNKSTFQPRGSTALLDAIGKTIDNVGKRLDNMQEKNKPEKIIVAILTDGEENSSRQYNLQTVKEMITHQREKYQWEFIFLGANQDAFAEASKIGIASEDTFNFDTTSLGVTVAYADMSKRTKSYR